MYNQVTTTGSLPIDQNTRVVIVNNSTNAVTITLPDATKYQHRIIWIKRFDSTCTGVITITSTAGNIENPFFQTFSASFALDQDFANIGFCSDGTVWHVISAAYAEPITIPPDKTASYTLTLADANKMIRMNVASGNILTLPALSFKIGTQFIITSIGTGQTTIAAGASATVLSNGNKLKLTGQYSIATAIYVANNTYQIAGDLTV